MRLQVLVTGGAGFVGSNLAVALREHDSGFAVIALDNLHRRGSELTVARLRAHGVDFRHGDIRCREDLEALPDLDLVIDCSAEPSVHAGQEGSPMTAVSSNLLGTVHCLELARRHGAAMLFLSTSRVYPIAALNALPYHEGPKRFEWDPDHRAPGFSRHGVAEGFTLDGARSLYGATKLASELLLREYAFSFGVPALINRCGVVAGPWQMARVDQGFVSLWLWRHLLGRPLDFIGYEGTGKQVRDVLHVADLCELVVRQISTVSSWDGTVYSVGGGAELSVSLRELTEHCQQLTGRRLEITPRPETHPLDVRIFITDSRRVQAAFDWAPHRGLETILDDTAEWIRAHEQDLRGALG